LFTPPLLGHGALGQRLRLELWGFVLAVVAIVSGLIGVVLSLSPTVRGGLVSTFSLVAGSIGLIAALIKALRWLL
jgi:hypothetical protein